MTVPLALAVAALTACCGVCLALSSHWVTWVLSSESWSGSTMVRKTLPFTASMSMRCRVPSDWATLASHSGAPSLGAGFGMLGLADPDGEPLGDAVASASVRLSSRSTSLPSGTSLTAVSAALSQVTFVAETRSLRSVRSSFIEADGEPEGEADAVSVADAEGDSV
ncbi:hypothetical protein STENM36S_06796 [Streptomyces tendae]